SEWRGEVEARLPSSMDNDSSATAAAHRRGLVRRSKHLSFARGASAEWPREQGEGTRTIEERAQLR
ncbi:MAG: hypothetical protein AAFS07_19445, partial [Pseudomonadota bacterium]